MKELIQKIKECKTMPELDDMRLELVTAGSGDQETFKKLQDAFKSQKNKLNRVPLSERTW